MVMVLKPLHDAARVKRVVVSTYQEVSGAGLAATTEMEQGTAAWLKGEAEPRSIFPHPIAANLIPQIGSPRPGGATARSGPHTTRTQPRGAQQTAQQHN